MCDFFVLEKVPRSTGLLFEGLGLSCEYLEVLHWDGRSGVGRVVMIHTVRDLVRGTTRDTMRKSDLGRQVDRDRLLRWRRHSGED